MEQRVLQPLALIQLVGELTLLLNDFLFVAGQGQNCGGGVGGGQRGDFSLPGDSFSAGH